jgi:hypothetical protein
MQVCSTKTVYSAVVLAVKIALVLSLHYCLARSSADVVIANRSSSRVILNITLNISLPIVVAYTNSSSSTYLSIGNTSEP